MVPRGLGGKRQLLRSRLRRGAGRYPQEGLVSGWLARERQLLRPLKGPQGAGILAPTNKSLARTNKSLTRGEATKKRRRSTGTRNRRLRCGGKDMAYASVTVKDLVERSVNHKWSIPEFQRGFVWKATQVRDVIESLWLNYPVGTLLVWDSSGPVQTRSASDAQDPDLWVVDGQQRTTALCILSGRKPYWCSSADDWEKIAR
jgi:hypothetical protein